MTNRKTISTVLIAAVAASLLAGAGPASAKNRHGFKPHHFFSICDINPYYHGCYYPVFYKFKWHNSKFSGHKR
jgi:hypothetical protein